MTKGHKINKLRVTATAWTDGHIIYTLSIFLSVISISLSVSSLSLLLYMYVYVYIYTTYQADMPFNYLLINEKLKVKEASQD